MLKYISLIIAALFLQEFGVQAYNKTTSDRVYSAMSKDPIDIKQLEKALKEKGDPNVSKGKGYVKVPAITRIFLDRKNAPTSKKNTHEALAALIGKDVNVNAFTEPSHNTALMFGALAGDVWIVKELLGNGADPNQVNKDEKSALGILVSFRHGHEGHAQVIHLLLENDKTTPETKQAACKLAQPAMRKYFGVKLCPEGIPE